MKGIVRRFRSLVLCMCMVMALLPNVTMTAFAATSGTVTGLADENIGLSFTGSADNAWSAVGTQIIGTARSTSESGCGGSSSDYRSTLTITNKKTTKATLSFDYTVVVSEGTILVDYTTTTTAGSFSQELAAGGTITVEIESGSTSAATQITMTNVKLVADVSATVTFQPAENGSYTVGGQTITEPYTHTQSSTTAYQLEATPAEGYRFKGWYDVASGKCISTDAMTALNFDSDRTITARFVSKELALFETGGQIFDDLNEAVAYAQTNGQSKITLATDGSIRGTYTIPAGITLLVPFDEAGTLYTTTPAFTTAAETQKAYRTLTMAAGSSITVDGGAISVGGKHFTSSNRECCKPTGAYGLIKMQEGSSIMLNNGANLYAWGYIIGDGSITANSGANVYEYYQVTDWRGGSQTGNMANNKQKVFPFTQYYVQNIEAALTLNAGANEYTYISVTASFIGTKSATIPFVGSNGLFKLGANGQFTKRYIPAQDRMVFTISGEASLNSIALSVAGVSVDSKDYVLPINNNVDIVITSGTTTIEKDAALLPGVTVFTAKDAELKVASAASLYVYDDAEWSPNYVWGSTSGICPVSYSPSGKGSRGIADAKVDVNGVLTVEGAVYTTATGANITSSEGTGKYAQVGAPGTSNKTYQFNQNSKEYIGVDITPAKLHNADGTYTGTAGSKAGDTYVYANGKWALKENKITITFDPNNGTGSMDPMTVNPGIDNTLTANTFTREGYSFTGWNTAANGTGAAYADRESVSFDADTILYAQWTQDPVITFNANGGEGTMGTQTVKPNEATALTANTFTRADYDFTGWNTANDGTGMAYVDKANIITNENVTLYAQWTLHKYHVRWLNGNSEILKEGYYTCKEKACYDMWFEVDPEPTMPEDENYTYKFLNRWTPYDEMEGINGWGFYPHKDVDFTAVYNKFEKLTVTFDANGGIGTMDSVKIVNGESGKYYTLPECGFTREGYTFKGWLITGMVKMSEWGEEEELNDEPWAEPELLALSNLTLKASWADKHSLTKVINKKDATCTEDGYTGDTVCAICGKEITKGKTIQANGHRWNEGKITTAPTCEKAGVKTYTCTVCNATKTEAIDATGHTPVEVAEQPATCTEAGHKAGTKCSVCDAILSGMEEIPATGHTEVIDARVEPTCTKPGKTEGKHCSVCNAVITAQEVIPAKGHTEVVDPAVEATCTATGLTEGKHCSVCNEITVAQEVVPMKEHTAVTVSGKAATCTEAGLTDGEKCSVCGTELKAQEPIKALGHSWDGGKVTTAPTYEKTGVKTYTCGICKATKTESIPQLVNSGSGSSGGGSNKTTTYPVNITTKTEDNGTTSFSSKMASKGNMVTITVEPERHYEVDEVIVRDSKGKQLAVKDNGDGTFTFEMPADKVTVEPTFTWVNPFADVANSAYYVDAVEWMLKREVTQGTTETTFSPNLNCTRAQIVTFLWRAAGSPEPKGTVGFADVSAGSYYAKAVAWAVENGITGGTGNGLFSPDATCTRAQSAAFLYRAAGRPAVNGSAGFSDVAADTYYAQAVAWAKEHGITGGIGGGLFGSANDCTRAQIAAFLWRLYADK